MKDTTWAAWSAYYTSDDYGYSAYSMTKYTVTFTEIVPGIYEATDLLGGFYTGLRGYGPVMVEMNDGDESAYPYYSMEGMVLLNADLTVNLITSGIQAWGDALTDLQGDLSYNIREKSEILDIHSLYGGMDFNVVMTRPLEEDIEEIEPIR